MNCADATPSFRRHLLVLAAASVATLGGMVSGGCSSHPQSQLSLISEDRKHDFDQTFGQAYIRKDETGNTEVVLIKETEPRVESDPDVPLTPTVVTPRQVVYIRVFWKPLPGTKVDHPAATNASIHWYVFGNGTNGADVLEYSGSGLVLVKDHGDTADVTVRTAFLRPTMQRGEMTDPLGPSTLKGIITAKTDNQHVDAILAELKATMNTPVEAQAAARPVGSAAQIPSGPPIGGAPARLPVGP